MAKLVQLAQDAERLGWIVVRSGLRCDSKSNIKSRVTYGNKFQIPKPARRRPASNWETQSTRLLRTFHRSVGIEKDDSGWHFPKLELEFSRRPQ